MDDPWAGAPITYEDCERESHILGTRVGPAKRLDWLESMMRFSASAGSLPLVYDRDGRRIDAPRKVALRRLRDS